MRRLTNLLIGLFALTFAIEALAGAPLEEVLNLAEEEGMERDKAEEVIEAMVKDGMLYKPTHGVIRVVR